MPLRNRIIGQEYGAELLHRRTIRSAARNHSSMCGSSSRLRASRRISAYACHLRLVDAGAFLERRPIIEGIRLVVGDHQAPIVGITIHEVDDPGHHRARRALALLPSEDRQLPRDDGGRQGRQPIQTGTRRELCQQVGDDLPGFLHSVFIQPADDLGHQSISAPLHLLHGDRRRDLSSRGVDGRLSRRPWRVFSIRRRPLPARPPRRLLAADDHEPRQRRNGSTAAPSCRRLKAWPPRARRSPPSGAPMGTIRASFSSRRRCRSGARRRPESLAEPWSRHPLFVHCRPRRVPRSYRDRGAAPAERQSSMQLPAATTFPGSSHPPDTTNRCLALVVATYSNRTISARLLRACIHSPDANPGVVQPKR